jgi:hypothetical protein
LNLQEAYNFLNFFINKFTGAFFSPEELDDIVDRGSMALYTDYQPKYATSQRVKDAMAPFRRVWSFTPSDTVSGVIPVPSNLSYLNLLSITVSYTISDRTTYAPVTMVNEDEIANRLNSQIDPVTVTSPIGEQLSPGFFRLYPLSGYTGNIVFLRRPVKPNFVYTTISERVIVYDDAASTQLEWAETEMDSVLLKALSTLGINLTDQEITQYAEVKNQQNSQGFNKS